MAPMLIDRTSWKGIKQASASQIGDETTAALQNVLAVLRQHHMMMLNKLILCLVLEEIGPKY